MPQHRHISRLAVLLTLWVGCVAARAATIDGVDTPPVIVYTTIGFAGPNRPDHQQIGRGAAWHGYPAVLRRELGPAIARGADRLQVQLPYGTPTVKPMSFTAGPILDGSWWRIQRADPALTRLSITSYTDAWRAIRKEAGRPLTVTHYLGAITLDPVMVGAKADPSAWLWWATNAVRGLDQPGDQVGLDASDQIVEGSAEHRFVQLLDALGVTPIIEPAPTAEHLLDYDCLALVRLLGDDQTLNGAYLDLVARERKGEPLPRGEVRVMVQGRVGGWPRDRWESLVREIVGRGHVPMIERAHLDWWVELWREGGK